MALNSGIDVISRRARVGFDFATFVKAIEAVLRKQKMEVPEVIVWPIFVDGCRYSDRFPKKRLERLKFPTR
jgi:hypothetical protein